jgi:hypothetical protein
MRTFTQRILFLLPLMVILTTCTKTVDKTHPDFVGYWRSWNTILDIKPDGSAYWGRGGTTEERVSGKVRIKDQTIIISGGGLKKKVRIDAYPHLEQANYTEFNTVLTLENDKFFKDPKISIDYLYKCSNGVQDEAETGVDCGGWVCDPCPTCGDHLKNQEEVGIDCGGPCVPCEEGECSNSLSSNTTNLKSCSGSPFISFSNPDFVHEDTATKYVLEYTFGQWVMYIAFPEKPIASLKYVLTEDYTGVDQTSDYNSASIQFKNFFGMNPGYVFSKDGGALYVIVNNGTLTITFCDADFTSTQYGCLKGSGKFIH